VTASSGITTPRIAWRVATVRAVKQETTRTRTIFLDVIGWPGHLAGQHVDVRLTAPDGYQAQRSYSIASSPDEKLLALTVEALEDGEVSSYLCGELRQGDELELRGPIGGYFVWRATDGGPLLLVAGGSGIVPLMAMLRHRAIALAGRPARHATPARLLYSSRSFSDVIYRDELDRMAADDDSLRVVHTITRDAPPGWTGHRRRIDRAMLEEVAWPPSDQPHVFVCGPTPMVEAAASALVTSGHVPERIRTERFGPTGS
jgi:ferredoxin-NADP reductase